MGSDEINPYLTHLAVEGMVRASTQNQALSALLFRYPQVLRLNDLTGSVAEQHVECVRADSSFVALTARSCRR